MTANEALEKVNGILSGWSFHAGFPSDEGLEACSVLRAALLERDALKAECVARYKDYNDAMAEVWQLKALVEDEHDSAVAFSAQWHKAEAERDDWRDKAMFQYGRANEAIKIAKEKK